MTDNELLEAAARALGARRYIEKHWPGLCLSGDPACTPFWVNADGNGARHWNPLENDGDALRLAIDLAMMVNMNVEAEEVEVYTNDLVIDVTVEYYGSDKYAAARRAIVKAAAALSANSELTDDPKGRFGPA